MEPTTLALAALGAAALLLAAVVRVTPPGRRGLVVRDGRVVRRHDGGALAALPLLERVVWLPASSEALDPVCVRARSRDGAEVTLLLSIVWQVADDALAAGSGADLPDRVADAADRAVRRTVAATELAGLLTDPVDEAAVVGLATQFVEGVGLEVVALDVLEAEVRVGPELLGLLG